ncbi:MAG: HD domain-containing protein [Acetatifactor sp.]|nr:HD domain-containing protein [Acetatifactor sp.]
MDNNIIEKMRREIVSRSDLFEEQTKGTKDEYNLYREHVQYVYKYAVMLAKDADVDKEVVELSALLHDILTLRAWMKKKRRKSLWHQLESTWISFWSSYRGWMKSVTKP